MGKVGVAIDSLDDMRTLFDGIPLDQVSTSMTINAPAALLLLMYQIVAEEQGADLRTAGRDDPERRPQGVHRPGHLHLPAPAVAALRHRHLRLLPVGSCPSWNTISISGYHIAEAGATPVQEIAFTLANAIEYVRGAVAAGLDVDEFAPRLSFFFVRPDHLLEEVAKFRAARRIWARIMSDQFGAADPRSMMLRFHTQTAGVELTAQQPEVNLVRVTLAALAAVLGGTQSLHTNSFDEALGAAHRPGGPPGRPHPAGARRRDRPDRHRGPVRGLLRHRALTDEIEDAARAHRRDRGHGRGGGGHRRGFQQSQIERNAYRIAREIDEGERVIVGVNKFVTEGDEPYRPPHVDPALAAAQAAKLAGLRDRRDQTAFGRAISALKSAAEGTDNVLYPLREALRADATLGEVCDALRDVWGEYQPESI